MGISETFLFRLKNLFHTPEAVNNVGPDCVKDYRNLDPPVQELIQAAIKARESSYSPYSKFAVGAAVRTSDGSIYSGCNIENGAYPAGICAERTAAAKAISEGKQDFVAIALVGEQKNGYITPCGMCRQFLSEFTKSHDVPLYASRAQDPPACVLCTSIYALLPRSFQLNNSK